MAAASSNAFKAAETLPHPSFALLSEGGGIEDFKTWEKNKNTFLRKAKRHATSGTVSGLRPSFLPSVRLGRRSGGTQPRVGLEGLETDVTLEIYTVRFKEQRL